MEISYFIKGGIICKEIMGVTFSTIFKKKVCEPFFFFPQHLLKTGFFLKSVVIFISRDKFLFSKYNLYKKVKLRLFQKPSTAVNLLFLCDVS
jgi:hypothetical protein